MAAPGTFDLTKALQRWREKLSQSPHFKVTDLAELESHIRDAVAAMQGKGLSTEESFLIATRRVGSTDALESEFAKRNASRFQKLMHAVVLAFFAFSSWCLWGMLMLPRMLYGAAKAVPMPGFTLLLVQSKWMLSVPPLIALGYCLLLWTGKVNPRSGWLGFFAVTAGIVIILTFPVILAVLLPLIDQLNNHLRP